MEQLSDMLRSLQKGFCAMVVVAAGHSERMGEDKLMLPLDGLPVLAYALTAFQNCGAVDEIVLVTRETLFDTVGRLREELGLTKLARMVPGGASRTESALAGVLAVSPRAKLIGIHDGARPFVTAELTEKIVRAAALHQAAAPALPVKDTLKRARDGCVVETPERGEFFAVQTPQVFRGELIKAALTKALKEKKSYTDDCAAVETMGVMAVLIPGDEENIKLTTPWDLALAETIMEKRREGRSVPHEDRTGI